MLMPGRSWNAQTPYRYGFNGKENDNEVKGVGDQQDYGMRGYDPRVGRFLSVDPIANKYAELTPYQFASNSPISGIDRDGEEFDLSIGETGRYRQAGQRLNQMGPLTPKNQTSASIPSFQAPPPKKDATTVKNVNKELFVLQTPSQFIIAGAQKCDGCATISAPHPQPSFDNDFERGMVTNPLIQTTAVGMAAPFVASGTMATGEWLFKPQTMGWASLGAGTSDVLIQGVTENWDITKYNFASTVGSVAFHNPLGGAVVGVGFQATLKDNGFTVHTLSPGEIAKQVALFSTGTMIGSGLGAATKGWAGDYFGNLLGGSVGNSVIVPFQTKTGPNTGTGTSDKPYVPSSTYQTGSSNSSDNKAY